MTGPETATAQRAVMSSGDTVGVRLSGLRKSFGDVEAVRGVDLDVADGEFFSLLGPSGSGKTTLLRMIAGFDLPTSGRILLQGKDVSKLAPFQRDVNTVFQDYALFPHMSVLQNIEYGLKVKKTPKSERTRLSREALASVQLEEYGSRKPTQLSGGQRQRVALARALVNRPKVLLLDEPLGALDLKLRKAMQTELKQLQRDVGITFVFVTHDQEEALAMSDRVAVMNAGRVEQVGTPSEVYESPATAFVADFVGTSNLLEGDAAQQILGSEGKYSVRPEKIEIFRAADRVDGDGYASATGTVSDVVFTGPSVRYVVDLAAGGTLSVVRQNVGAAPGGAPAVADQVLLRWRDEHSLRLDDTD
jgi:putative spermidine/putrescine transport system ATP-binding protein